MQRRTLRSILRFLFGSLSKVEVWGLEHMPREGGCLMVTNHLSRLDSPLIFSLIERDDVSGLVADKYKNHQFFRWIVRQVDGIWINREAADFHALKAAVSYLQNGGMLGIAPEGTRSTIGDLQAAKTGAAYLAERASVRVLPVAIWGTERAFHELYHLRRPSLSVSLGPLFRLPPVERRRRDEDLQRNTDEIMCRIAAMLPAQYRGAYTNHPRLIEFLNVPNPITHPGYLIS